MFLSFERAGVSTVKRVSFLCFFLCWPFSPRLNAREREKKNNEKNELLLLFFFFFAFSCSDKKKRKFLVFSPFLAFLSSVVAKKKEKRSRFLAQSKKIYRKRTFEASGGRVDPNKLISFRSVVFAEEKIGESTRHHFVAFASKSTRTRER